MLARAGRVQLRRRLPSACAAGRSCTSSSTRASQQTPASTSSSSPAGTSTGRTPATPASRRISSGRCPKASPPAPLQFPAPKRLPLGPLMDFGYENEVLFPFCFNVAESAKPGPAILHAKVDWLVCREVASPARPSLRSTGTSHRRARPLSTTRLMQDSSSAWSAASQAFAMQAKSCLPAHAHWLPPRRRHRPRETAGRLLSRRSGHPRQSRAAKVHAHGEGLDARSKERPESHRESCAVERSSGAFRR